MRKKKKKHNSQERQQAVVMKDRSGSKLRPLQPQPRLCIYGLFSFLAPPRRQHQGVQGGGGGGGGHPQSSPVFPESSLVNTGTNVLEGEHLNGSCEYQRPAWRRPFSNSGSPGNNTARDNGIGGLPASSDHSTGTPGTQ